MGNTFSDSAEKLGLASKATNASAKYKQEDILRQLLAQGDQYKTRDNVYNDIRDSSEYSSINGKPYKKEMPQISQRKQYLDVKEYLSENPNIVATIEKSFTGGGMCVLHGGDCGCSGGTVNIESALNAIDFAQLEGGAKKKSKTHKRVKDKTSSDDEDDWDEEDLLRVQSRFFRSESDRESINIMRVDDDELTADVEKAIKKLRAQSRHKAMLDSEDEEIMNTHDRPRTKYDY